MGYSTSTMTRTQFNTVSDNNHDMLFSNDLSEEEFTLQDIESKLGDVSNLNAENINANDVLPSSLASKSPVMEQIDRFSDVASQSKVSSTATTKTKVIATCCIATVLVLVASIILLTVAVSGSFGAVMTEQQQYEALVNQLAVLTENATEIDYQQMYDKAISLGFVPVSDGNSYTFTQLQTRPAQNFNIEGNWFDSLCDWVSGVFGG